MSKRVGSGQTRSEFAMGDYETTHQEGEFGELSWNPIQRDGEPVGEHDPFENRLQKINKLGMRDRSAGLVLVRETLETAQCMAISVFGRDWKAHVIDLYDRIVQMEQELGLFGDAESVK